MVTKLKQKARQSGNGAADTFALKSECTPGLLIGKQSLADNKAVDRVPTVTVGVRGFTPGTGDGTLQPPGLLGVFWHRHPWGVCIVKTPAPRSGAGGGFLRGSQSCLQDFMEDKTQR